MAGQKRHSCPTEKRQKYDHSDLSCGNASGSGRDDSDKVLKGLCQAFTKMKM